MIWHRVEMMMMMPQERGGKRKKIKVFVAFLLRRREEWDLAKSKLYTAAAARRMDGENKSNRRWMDKNSMKLIPFIDSDFLLYSFFEETALFVSKVSLNSLIFTGVQAANLSRSFAWFVSFSTDNLCTRLIWRFTMERSKFAYLQVWHSNLFIS